MQDKLGEMRGEEAAERDARQAAQAAAAAEEEKAKKREAASRAVRTRTSWEEDEIRMLEKALDKFPQVLQKRSQGEAIRSPMLLFARSAWVTKAVLQHCEWQRVHAAVADEVLIISLRS